MTSLLQLQNLVTLSISFSGMGARAATSLLVGLPQVERLLLDGIPISMLGIRSLFRSRPSLLLWSPRAFSGPPHQVLNKDKHHTLVPLLEHEQNGTLASMINP